METVDRTIMAPRSIETVNFNNDRAENAQSIQRKVQENDAATSSAQLIFLTMGMMIFFVTQNLLQEAITKIPDFKFGVMLGYMEVVG